MNETYLTAKTHYADYKGTISIDKDDLKNPFFDLAKDNGIDMDKYYLVSVSFKSYKGGRDQTVIVDTTDVVTNYEDLENYLKCNDSLPITRFSIEMDIHDLLKYTKQFNFMYTFNEALIGQKINIIK